MGYDMDPSVKHRIQERPDPREQLLKSLNTINKAIESGFESLERHNPSVEQTTKYPSPVDKPSTSASTVYNIGPSAKHRNQKWLAAREQLLTNFKTMKKVVESSFEVLEEYSPPVPSSEQTTKKSKDSDAVEEYRPPVPSSEQTTKESKDSDAVDKSSLSTSTAEGYDMDLTAKRRSVEQPDSQVISSEQTRKGKGAVDDMHKRKSGEVDNDDTRKRKRAEADTDDE